MAISEAQINGLGLSSEKPWSARETAEVLMLLQDQTINWLTVGTVPDHAHFAEMGRLDKYPPTIQEWLQPILLEAGPGYLRYAKLNAEFEDYLRPRGLNGEIVMNFFENKPLSTFSMGINRKENLWIPQTFVDMDQLDCRAICEMSETVIKNSPPNLYYLSFHPHLYVNTTRVGDSGPFYRIDIALGVGKPRTYQAVEEHIMRVLSTSIDYREFGAKDALDALVITKESQQVLTALLAGRE